MSQRKKMESKWCEHIWSVMTEIFDRNNAKYQTMMEWPFGQAAEWIAMSVELHHAQKYVDAINYFSANEGKEFPDWDELEPERRESIREANRNHAKEMMEFGKKISEGRL